MAVQMLCDQLDGLTGADQQRAVALESGENLACQAYCRIGDGYRAGADVGVRPNMLRYRKCMLKQTVEYRAGSAGGMCQTVGILHLAENLRFSEDRRIQPGGHGERMMYGLIRVQRVDAPG
jgi:hypothetical protein